jgi:hypothetical protein
MRSWPATELVPAAINTSRHGSGDHCSCFLVVIALSASPKKRFLAAG